jgi:hypothetical protein
MRRFVSFYSSLNICKMDQMKESQMSRMYDVYGKEGNCVQVCGGKT